MVDISPRGAGLLVASEIQPNTEVRLLLRQSGLPGQLHRSGVPVLTGRVKSVRRLGAPRENADAGGYRLGIEFLPPADDVSSKLDELLRTLRSSDTLDEASAEVDAGLSATARGRESLYQSAFAHLDGGRLGQARDVLMWALKGDPHNPYYRALLHRVNAEKAFSHKLRAVAAHEVARALMLFPEDPDLLDLEDRIRRSTTLTPKS